MRGYGARTDALLDRLSVGDAPTDQDFIDLALACLDQGGCTVGEQLAVLRIVEHRTSKRALDSLREIVMGTATRTPCSNPRCSHVDDSAHPAGHICPQPSGPATVSAPGTEVPL